MCTLLGNCHKNIYLPIMVGWKRMSKREIKYGDLAL